MKAAVLEQLNAPLTVADIGLTDLSYGQVLVRVLASGICGAQLQEIAGHKGNERFLPHLLGHEGCGIVADVGVGVRTVRAGDKVIMHWRKSEGSIESDFPRYVFRDRVIESGKVITFSEYSICSENRVTRVPTETPVELCALLGCGLSTALSTLERAAALRCGESILILGVGGLGVNLIRVARMLCATPVIAVDVHPWKDKTAREMGAHHYVNISPHYTLGASLREFGQTSFDVIVDTAGRPETIKEALPLLNSGGRFIMVGHPKPGESIELVSADHMFNGKGKSIKATQGGGFAPGKDIPRYLQLYRSGDLKLDGIITQRIRLDDINDGIDLVRSGHASRVLIEMVSRLHVSRP